MHSADIVHRRRGARDRADWLSSARYTFDRNKARELRLDAERAKEYLDEMLLVDISWRVDACSTRALEHSPMQTKITVEV